MRIVSLHLSIPHGPPLLPPPSGHAHYQSTPLNPPWTPSSGPPLLDMRIISLHLSIPHGPPLLAPSPFWTCALSVYTYQPPMDPLFWTPPSGHAHYQSTPINPPWTPSSGPPPLLDMRIISLHLSISHGPPLLDPSPFWTCALSVYTYQPPMDPLFWTPPLWTCALSVYTYQPPMDPLFWTPLLDMRIISLHLSIPHGPPPSFEGVFVYKMFFYMNQISVT